MRQFGRKIVTSGAQPGGLLPIEATMAQGYPSINVRSLLNARELRMHQLGVVSRPPAQILGTQYASAGCVPICAAEITPPRTVDWIYLIHGHQPNFPQDLAAIAANPANVYVCMLGSSEGHGEWWAEHALGIYFQHLDPGDRIPNNNALLIYGPQTQVVITRQAVLAVSIER